MLSEVFGLLLELLEPLLAIEVTRGHVLDGQLGKGHSSGCVSMLVLSFSMPVFAVAPARHMKASLGLVARTAAIAKVAPSAWAVPIISVTVATRALTCWFACGVVVVADAL